jgi:hypothetical protein
VRYLKGHGTDYALDAATWAHYRREKLTKLQLFKVRQQEVPPYKIDLINHKANYCKELQFRRGHCLPC